MSLTCFLGLDLAIIKHFSNNYYMNITEIVVKKKKDKKKKNLNYLEIPVSR